jgi:aerobic C4-dicarboxylate transport protein
VAAYTGPGKLQSATDFLLNVIPTTVVDAFAKGEILQVLLFAVLFGFALQRLGARGAGMLGLVDGLSQVLFGIVAVIMKLAPLGAFGAMAATVGKYGLGSLASLGALMASFYVTCLLFIFGALGMVARLHGFSIWRFVAYIRDELLIVLGTSSSESVLPRMIAKMQKIGVSKPVVGLVIPAGYSFNLDGTSIYLTMATLFIAQATNTPMNLPQQLTLLAVLLLTSKGAAGVTGAASSCWPHAVLRRHPAGGGSHADFGNRPVHVGGACTHQCDRQRVAALVVAKWTGELDVVTMRRELGGDTGKEGSLMHVSDGFTDAIGNTPVDSPALLSEETGWRDPGKGGIHEPRWLRGRPRRKVDRPGCRETRAVEARRHGGGGHRRQHWIGLAHVCNARGYKCVIVMPDNQAAEKYKSSRHWGRNCAKCPRFPTATPTNIKGGGPPGKSCPTRFGPINSTISRIAMLISNRRGRKSGATPTAKSTPSAHPRAPAARWRAPPGI